jgi:putative redox protein
MPELTVAHDAGDRFISRIRDHEVVFDQPEALGGTDTAPSPTETFVASLGACVAFYGRRFLSRHGLPEDLEVAIAYELSEDRPHRVARIQMQVTTPEPVPDARAVAFRRVLEGCVLHHTLHVPPDLSIGIGAGSASVAPHEAAGTG